MKYARFGRRPEVRSGPPKALIGLLMGALAVSAAGPGSAAPARSTWRYTVSRDAMRGTADRTACVRSTNRASLGFPYHDQAVELCVRRQGGVSKVFIRLPLGGQFLTHDGISVRLDGGAVEAFDTGGALDGSSNLLFVDQRFESKESFDARQVISKIAAAKRERDMAATDAKLARDDDAANAARLEGSRVALEISTWNLTHRCDMECFNEQMARRDAAFTPHPVGADTQGPAETPAESAALAAAKLVIEADTARPTLATEIAGAKRLTVEVGFYRNGTQQIRFDVGALAI